MELLLQQSNNPLLQTLMRTIQNQRKIQVFFNYREEFNYVQRIQNAHQRQMAYW
jgi:hypothetical protein